MTSGEKYSVLNSYNAYQRLVEQKKSVFELRNNYGERITLGDLYEKLDKEIEVVRKELFDDGLKK